MLADRLAKAWEAHRGSTPIDRVMRFSNEGLVLGAGTVLAPSRGGARDISIDPLGPRLSALLAAAHLRNPVFSDLAHLRKAADLWSQGDDALASMHLALSRFERLRQPEADAHRLFLADGLLKSGVPSDDIIHAIEMGPAAFERLCKYSVDQPRVPAGSGRPSGQWTSGGSSGPAAGSASSTTQQGEPAPVKGSGETRSELSTGSATSPIGPADSIIVPGWPVYGDMACYAARTDCVKYAASLPANDNSVLGGYETNIRCKMAEFKCNAIALAVEVIPNLERGAQIFPGGGVVIVGKGLEDKYYPPGTLRRIPFRPDIVF